ncbi:MAG: MOSC domain-containing protein [Terracidiphilus sp.]
MKLLSLNTGLPRDVQWNGEPVQTGIFKSPVAGRVPLRKLNLDGDRQADLTVHGGEHKAVYCYPFAHYSYWEQELDRPNLPMGAFGENFTIEDSLLEDAIHLGDRFAVGSAEIVVTQPRMPCFKLIIRFGIDDIVKRFLDSGRSGFYVLVAKEGEVGAGDEIRLIARDPNAVPVSEIRRLYIAKEYSAEDRAILDRILRVPSVPEGWKHHFRNHLQVAALKAHA